MRRCIALAALLAVAAGAPDAAAAAAGLQPFLAAQPHGCMVTPPAGQPVVPPKLSRGDRMLVCIQLDGAMAVFDVGVDVFTGLQVAGSHNASAAATAASVSTLAVAAGLASSDDPALATGAKKVYWQPDTGSGGGKQYLPTYTAVIQLVKGEPTSVTFDDGCFFCDGATGCGPNALPVEGGPPVDGNVQKGCALPEAACASIGTAANPDANTCDLTVFVAFTGSDASGAYMTSAGKRFSRYRQYGLQLPALWDTLRRSATDAVNRLNVDGGGNRYAQED